jgi:hypothetical protein
MTSATHLDQDALAAIQLIKWPGCDVDGMPVTPTQAMEILVRTNGTYFSTNDREFEQDVERIFYAAIPKPEWDNEWWITPEPVSKPTEEHRSYWFKMRHRIEEYCKQMGILNLEYLKNQRVCSSFIGGPHGWCNWNGNIFQRGINIGKWPSTTEVYEEWQMIAAAFPYLNLTCRLLSHEAGYAEGNPGIAVVYEVKDGQVIARLPADNEIEYVSSDKDSSDITDIFINRMMYSLDGRHKYEHGVSLQDWKRACHHVAKVMTEQ